MTGIQTVLLAIMAFLGIVYTIATFVFNFLMIKHNKEFYQVQLDGLKFSMKCRSEDLPRILNTQALNDDYLRFLLNSRFDRFELDKTRKFDI